MSSWKKFKASVLTGSGIKKHGFFIPYRYADSVTPVSYPFAADLLDRQSDGFSSLLERSRTYAAEFERFGGEAPAPRFEQDWFAGLDLVMAYTLVRERKPQTIIEIGSGHSTRVMARAIADGEMSTRLIAVDPSPRAPIKKLKVEHKSDVLSASQTIPFDLLDEGDWLFVDSSHLGVPGCDVDLIVNHVLPALKPGVMIHFHDIFLPDPYPESWQWRGYGEQVLLAALLQGRAYKPVFASHYVKNHMKGTKAASIAASIPNPFNAFETSFYLKKIS